MKKNMIVSIFMLLSLTIFGNSKIKVIAPAGAPMMTLLKTMDENEGMLNKDIEYEILNASDVLASKIISKEADIAIVPSNLASNLYNRGIDIRLVSTSVWGVLYLVSRNDSIKTWDDLRGKEIVSIGRNLTPDAILQYLIKANGLEVGKDIKVNYINSAPELAQLFLAGKIDTAIIPEPILSSVLMKEKETNIIFNIQDEWEKASKAAIPQAVMIVQADLVENDREFLDKFVESYKNSIEWVNANPNKAGEISSKFNKKNQGEIIASSISRSNLMFKSAKDSKKDLEEYYEVLLKFNPKLIGGKLPDDKFYYEK
ncbi:ABC transporter substrate-binding protein [Fusobacterium sp. MFO224]|uniref:ABC transporter substrate-binding protein n=1 Tax=Fusobacterium sp. MFO224 TaxID=3378070 RepID=UPI003854053C